MATKITDWQFPFIGEQPTVDFRAMIEKSVEDTGMTFEQYQEKINRWIEYLVVMQNEEFFLQITNKSRTVTQPAMQRLTQQEMIARAEKSENDIQNHRVITQSQLEKESLMW